MNPRVYKELQVKGKVDFSYVDITYKKNLLKLALKQSNDPKQSIA